jgi:heme A synthase
VEGSELVRTLRWVAAVAAVLTFGLIVLGALVRSTNSGLSCPDWPTCYGQWVLTPGEFAAIPDTGYFYWQVMLEWVHRLIAGFFLGPLVLVIVVLGLRLRRQAPALARGALLLLLLLLVQGALGGVTVLDANSPWSVALHLGTALLLLTTLLYLAVRAGGRRGRPAGPRVIALAGMAWALALLAMLTAAMTAKSGASLACSTWPLCDGAVLPDLGDSMIRIHFAHRLLAAFTGLAVLGLFIAARPAGPAVRRLAGGALLLVLGQIALGALIIVLQIPTGAAVLHQAVGVLTFATVTTLLWLAVPAAEGARPPSGERHGYALRSA